MSRTHDHGPENDLPSSAPPQSECEPGNTESVRTEDGVCLLCGGPLADGGGCNRCQLSRNAIERIFREQRSEEARTPCAPLAFLALIALLAAAGLVVWVALVI